MDIASGGLGRFISPSPFRRHLIASCLPPESAVLLPLLSPASLIVVVVLLLLLLGYAMLRASDLGDDARLEVA
eukprot:683942-Pyramimonas_sp.AAC.1